MDKHDKYDLVVHILTEARLTDDERLAGVQKLFPLFTPESPHNDDLITDYIIEKFAYGRSVGMTVSNAAHSAEVSNTLMSQALAGVGLSTERFLSLVRAELYAMALCKRKHIANIGKASENGDYKASIAFLEKLYPADYGAKLVIDEPVKRQEANSTMELARKVAFVLQEAIVKGSSPDDGVDTAEQTSTSAE